MMETLAFTYYAVSYEDPSQKSVSPSLNYQGLGGTLVLLSLLCATHFPSYAIAYRQGDRGDTVVKIQQTLGIPADGIYGRQTERAVRDYQKRQSLRSVDGIAGSETLASLGLNAPENTGGKTLQAVIRTPDRKGVNVRSTPNGAKIGGLAEAATVFLTGEEKQLGRYLWVKTTQNGWIAKTFLQPVLEPQKTASPQTSTQARVTSPNQQGINTRRHPNGEKVGSLPEGTLVILTGEERSQGGYTWVQTRQGTWIAKDFLQIVETRSRQSPELSTPLTQNFQGDRGQFPAIRNAQKYDRPNGEAIGSVEAGDKLRVTNARSLANGIAWAKLADDSWVDSRAIGF
ncbi:MULTISPECIES: peptidoglycan-binding domain-containing protein [Spirulina sp. CCY15215]|uniref:peptidoglycan-binding domain-containing protein n=1 Tax=Spirulina sp. CCY15215 TaxID=2767591 RepID=UPI0019500DBE|nr:peptidoglycan-binding domain-containing protein [Spirulina major]